MRLTFQYERVPDDWDITSWLEFRLSLSVKIKYTLNQHFKYCFQRLQFYYPALHKPLSN